MDPSRETSLPAHPGANHRELPSDPEPSFGSALRATEVLILLLKGQASSLSSGRNERCGRRGAGQGNHDRLRHPRATVPHRLDFPASRSPPVTAVSTRSCLLWSSSRKDGSQGWHRSGQVRRPSAKGTPHTLPTHDGTVRADPWAHGGTPSSTGGHPATTCLKHRLTPLDKNPLHIGSYE